MSETLTFPPNFILPEQIHLYKSYSVFIYTREICGFPYCIIERNTEAEAICFTLL
jgi:hypothetical protein